jgi:hypothetical protein
MAFKSVRLLNEAIHNEIGKLRLNIGAIEPSSHVSAAQDALVELRKLFDELAAMAERPSIEDVTKLSPGDYVATMKPLVGKYHRQLMVVDRLAACLCEDLQATGCILMLVGDGKTIVRTAADPNRPEVQLAVETILASLDSGTKQVVTESVAEAEKQLGIAPNDDDVPMGGSPDEETAALADLKDEPS